MAQNKVLILLFVLSCMHIRPAYGQFDGITFEDSVYVASQTHYFIPQTIGANDTSDISDLTRFDAVEWRENGQILDLDSTMEGGRIVYPHQFTETGSFDITLEMVDTAGLSYFASKTILVSGQIEVPNVFSPDDDGINDVFIVKSGGTARLNLKIYTRNGDLIYEKIGQVVYWDGKLASGNYARPGVYYYVVKSQGEPRIIRKGFFHLFR